MSNGSNSKTSLNIYAGNSKVGKLLFVDSSECDLIYETDWIAHGFPLSPALPFSGNFEPNAIVNFLKNIFPEGEALQNLLDLNRLSKDNIYAILSTIGHDTSGALVFANKPANTKFKELRKVTESELIKRLNKNTTRDLILWDGKYRLSVAGVQNKLNVLIATDGNMFLADGQYASTHIMKFASLANPHITINEFYCMKLASMAGICVADVQLKKLGEHYTLVVKRFDRKHQDDKILKAHIVDGCQVLNLPPSYKYEQNFGSSKDVKHIRDGSSLVGLFNFSNQCTVPITVKQSILDWVLFNILIGNSDAHGKNISFMVVTNLYQLAPFYDLLSIVYEAKNNKMLDTGLAMAIGEQFDINKVTAYDLLSLSDEVGIPFQHLKNRMNKICKKTLNSLSKVDKLSKPYDTEVHNIFNGLSDIIYQRCMQLLFEYEQLDKVRNSAF